MESITPTNGADIQLISLGNRIEKTAISSRFLPADILISTQGDSIVVDNIEYDLKLVNPQQRQNLISASRFLLNQISALSPSSAPLTNQPAQLIALGSALTLALPKAIAELAQQNGISQDRLALFAARTQGYPLPDVVVSNKEFQFSNGTTVAQDPGTRLSEGTYQAKVSLAQGRPILVLTPILSKLEIQIGAPINETETPIISKEAANIIVSKVEPAHILGTFLRRLETITLPPVAKESVESKPAELSTLKAAETASIKPSDIATPKSLAIAAVKESEVSNIKLPEIKVGKSPELATATPTNPQVKIATTPINVFVDESEPPIASESKRVIPELNLPATAKPQTPVSNTTANLSTNKAIAQGLQVNRELKTPETQSISADSNEMKKGNPAGLEIKAVNSLSQDSPKTEQKVEIAKPLAQAELNKQPLNDGIKPKSNSFEPIVNTSEPKALDSKETKLNVTEVLRKAFSKAGAMPLEQLITKTGMNLASELLKHLPQLHPTPLGQLSELTELKDNLLGLASLNLASPQINSTSPYLNANAITSLFQLLLGFRANNDTTQISKKLANYLDQLQAKTGFTDNHLAQLTKAGALESMSQLASSLHLYQQASNENNGNLVWFFALPYGINQRQEQLEGKFEQQADEDEQQKSPNWHLQLKFNLAQGPLLITARYHQQTLDLQFKGNSEQLLHRVDMFLPPLGQKLSQLGFMPGELSTQIAQVPATLLPGDHFLVKTKA
ncbi:flagellar hook-length control protein FliK [Shewanella acanthi]|uniref:flagellar hook-length control protein FliK n=1 Tax=Shewanella acanthi TaxID=2864212 RepID=UPI001C660D26|nr:flagellar hook-length control protein FliK [Shewanella acanthi]QYJ79915.1 flagellar hook-length control protein FliK [Shewanella acanthi]